MYQWLIPGAVYLGKKDTADKYKDTHTHKKRQTKKQMSSYRGAEKYFQIYESFK